MFKAKAGLEALQEVKTINDVGHCQEELQEQAKMLFEGKRGPKPIDKSDLLFSHLIDEEYTRIPFYGSRKMLLFSKRRATPLIVSGSNA